MTAHGVLLACIAATSGCAHFGKASKNPTTADSALTEPATKLNPAELEVLQHLTAQERADLYYTIMLANIAASRQEYELAVHNYLYAAYVTKNVKLARYASYLAAQTNASQELEQAALLWVQAEPRDITAQQLLTIAYLRLEKEEKALFALKRLVDLLMADKRAESLEELGRVASSAPSMLTYQLLQRQAKQYPISSDEYVTVLLSAAELASDMEQTLLATQEVDRVLVAKPEFVPAIKLKAYLIEKTQNTREARDYLAERTLVFPGNRDLRMVYGNMLFQLKDYHTAQQQFEFLLEQNAHDNEARFAYAVVLYENGDMDQSYRQFSRLSSTDYRTAQVLSYLGDIAEQQNDNGRALEYYQKIPEGKYYLAAQIQIARLLTAKGELEEAIAHLEKQSATGDDRTQLMLAELELLHKAGQLDRALKRLKQAHAEQPEALRLWLAGVQLASARHQPWLAEHYLQQALQRTHGVEEQKQVMLSSIEYLRRDGFVVEATRWIEEGLRLAPGDHDFIYARALVAERMQKWQDAERDLRYVLQRDPENAAVLNALGYLLADHNQRLDEAYALIERALQLTPSEPSVLDSMGWVAYRKKEYDKAIEYLQHAYKLSKDPEIAAHLAEVLKQAKHKREAKKIAREALDIYPQHPKLMAIMKSL